MDFLSGRYRDVERDLERKMTEASDAEEFERAATYRDRLEAVRSLMQRRSVAGESLETADLIAVAVEGTGANAQVFQVRDGVLAERQGFYLANEGERGETEVTEEFIAQYYSAVPAVPRLVVVGQALSRPGRAAGGGALDPSRRPGRGARRRARGQAAPPGARRAQRAPCARAGQAAPGAPATAAGGRARRAAGRARARLAARPDPGVRHLQPRPDHTVASMVVFEAERRRSRTTADSRSGAIVGAGTPPPPHPAKAGLSVALRAPWKQRKRRAAIPAPTISPPLRRCSVRRAARFLEQADLLASRRRARRGLRRAARPDRDRRWQGAASAGIAPSRRSPSGASRWSGSRSGSRRSSFRAAWPRSRSRRDSEALRLLQPVRDEAAPVRDRVPPPAPRPVDHAFPARRAAGRGAGPQARAPDALRLARVAGRREPRRARGRPRHPGKARPRHRSPAGQDRRTSDSLDISMSRAVEGRPVSTSS